MSKKKSSKKKSRVKKGNTLLSPRNIFIAVIIIFSVCAGSVLHVYKSRLASVSNQQANNTKISNHANVQVEKSKTNSQADSYVITHGDNLWNISVKVYHTGYKWKEIAKANNIKTPGIIFAGTKLIIPTSLAKDTIAKTVTVNKTVQTAQKVELSTQSEKIYQVQHGDSLWNIAVREYGNGYNWLMIAKANNLSQPGLIFAGNKLRIPPARDV